MTFDPLEASKWTGGIWNRRPSESIRGFTIDSRTVVQGDCFVALKTEKRDGHAYLADAAKKGAVAAIVEREIDHELPQLVVPSSERGLQDCAAGYRSGLTLPIVGISGSCGKTSTKDLLSCLLGDEVTLSTEANLNNTLGVPLTLLKIDETKHTYAVVEAGINRRGEMDTISAILKPNLGIITMVGTAHSEGLGGIENIAVEKCKLLEATADDGLVVFPSDCKAFEVFKRLKKAYVLDVERRAGEPSQAAEFCFQVNGKGTGFVAANEFCARDTEIETRDTEIDRQRMQVCGGEKRAIIVDFPAAPVFFSRLPQMSEGMASNCALAIVIARFLGVSDHLISSRLEEWRPSAGRGELYRFKQQLYLVDCYNANPSSMQDTIEFFSARWKQSPKLFVLGSMKELGCLFEGGHRDVGAFLVLEEDDQVVFIGEGAAAFKEGALMRGTPEEKIYCFDEALDAKPIVDLFSGAILLKGSRRYALERLLPTGAEPVGSEAVAC